jgi:hypothetical protein
MQPMSLRERSRGKIVESAFINLPNAVLIGASIILGGMAAIGVDVAGLPAWIPLIGTAGAFFANSLVRLFDTRRNQQVVSQLLREQYNLDELRIKQHQQYLAQAIAYRQRIDEAVTKLPDGPMRTRLADVANQVEEWVRRIYTLAKRVEVYRGDPLIQRDLVNAESNVSELRARLARERSPSVRTEIEDTMRRREQQRDMLQQLDDTMDRAELQMESTLTALGTVYSQILLVDAKDVDSARAQRLSEDVAEQVQGLQDVLSSVDEVYAQRRGNLSNR